MRHASMSFVFCLFACGSKSAPPPSQPTPPTGSPVEQPSSGAVAECMVSGCSGSLCVKKGDDTVTTCEMKAEYACYTGAECKPQADGQCGWTMDDRLKSCLANPPAMK